MEQYPADLFAEFWKMLEARINELRDLDDVGIDEQQAASLIAEALRILGTDGAGTDAVRDWAGTQDVLRVVAAAQAIEAWYEPLAEDGERAADLDDVHTTAKHFYRIHHRLNLHGGVGQVILRRPLWGRWSDPLHPLPGDALALSDFFSTLMLMPCNIEGTDPDAPSSKRIIQLFYKQRLSADARLLDTDATWKIGFAPVAETEQELEIVSANLNGLPAYDARVVRLDERFDVVIGRLCAEDCHIIVLPEMVLHEESLNAVRAAIKRHGPKSSLVLVLAGTRRALNQLDMPPFNEAMVFDHMGNAVLYQAKLSRWNITNDTCHRYDIAPPPTNSLRYEYITPGDKMFVVEQPGLGRLAVLVCEDLGRSEPGRWIRSNMLLDLQFTPVLDSHLDPYRWSAVAGGRAVRSGRCRVLVASSLPLTLRQNRMNASSNPEWVVTEFGVGLGIDAARGDVRCSIATVPASEAADVTATLSWEVETWDVLPLLTP